MCLSLIQVGGFADGAADAARHPRAAARGRRDKHTSRNPYRIKYGKAEPFGARHRREPAWRLPRAYRNGHFPFLSRICTFVVQFAFGIWFITALLTAPTSTPSSQHRKSSNRSSFLSSSPNGHTTSSSITSETKNCGRPLE